ncbi:hypothetical protein [Alcanivorax sediminis]|uniref:Uncharacterized protein n=1 Tax=Alcanivorax sediminis TaxID=2663008 RepID=A0A6N7LSQ1_9GAMM|nr:hypothetical protein [Alcanivorax sediminis]MQX53468.1 hypothetical protein [Alcanivorax sediminis]
MEDIKTLFIGVLGGLMVLGIAKAYKSYRNKSVQEDIKFLEFEKKHLGEMKKSSVEMNRSSFRAIFALFLFIGLANLTPRFFDLINVEALSGLSSLVTMIIWAMFIGLCIKFWRRYENLKNFKEAMDKLDDKIEKLRGKLPE